jgi:hypothetical protein
MPPVGWAGPTQGAPRTVASTRLGRRCWQQMMDVFETELLPNLARESPWQVRQRHCESSRYVGPMSRASLVKPRGLSLFIIIL